MPRKARPHPKPQRQPTQIKAWRKHRGLTLAKLSERLQELAGIEISDAQLSRIERAEQPYSQDVLEGMAKVLQCEPAHLLHVNPLGQNPRWSIWEQASPAERQQAEAFIETVRKTGTGS
jgi:transcriptional regulator with XRE-family HTH domain